MSDFRDPRDPVPYSYDQDAVRRMQAEAMGNAWGLGPIIGLVLLLGVLFFAFSGSENTRVAQNETPPATTTNPVTPPISPPAEN